jgi:hypothetical protein
VEVTEVRDLLSQVVTSEDFGPFRLQDVDPFRSQLSYVGISSSHNYLNLTLLFSRHVLPRLEPW